MQDVERKKKTSSNKKYQKLNTKKIQLTQLDIRQEDETLNPSILDIFHAREERDYDGDVFAPKNKSTIINEVNELIDEIENTYQSIEEYSVEHIHSNELILTYGYSKTVYHFLKYAAKYRSFDVYICESAPSLSGQSMAHDLVKESRKHKNRIKSVTLISDSSIFAIMSRVNKVLLFPNMLLCLHLHGFDHLHVLFLCSLFNNSVSSVRMLCLQMAGCWHIRALTDWRWQHSFIVFQLWW